MAERLTAEDVQGILQQRGWSTKRLAEYIGCNQSTAWRMAAGGNISGPAEKILRGLLPRITHTEDGTVIAFDPETKISVSGATKDQAVERLGESLRDRGAEAGESSTHAQAYGEANGI